MVNLYRPRIGNVNVKSPSNMRLETAFKLGSNGIHIEKIKHSAN
jgi:hypothetical protein